MRLLMLLLSALCAGAAPSNSDYPISSSSALQLVSRKSSRCEFPAGWQGQWFLMGFTGEISINRSSMSSKGDCVEQKSDKSADKFLIIDRSMNCRQCIVAIAQPHANIIQYKEGECEPLDDENFVGRSFKDLCDTITGNSELFTMFRLHAAPEACPFGGRFSFTYEQGSVRCQNPVSHAESCVRDSEMMLHYRSCPDQTEERKVRLECLAHWRDGEKQYLVGHIFHHNHLASSYDESFRCFLYKETANGVQLSQSADASCKAVNSPTEGPLTLAMTRVSDPQPECIFPSWLTDRATWQDMAGTQRYVFTPAKTSFQILTVNQTSEKHQVRQEATCMNRDSPDAPSSSWFRVVTLVARGCEKGFRCYNWLRRADQIVQVQEGEISRSEELACSEEFLNNRTAWTTLIAQNTQSIACPFPGQYLVSTPRDFAAQWPPRGYQRCSQMTKVTIGCQRHSAVQMQAHPVDDDCPTAPEDTNPMHFACHGHWMENQIGYFVATETRSTRKHCFTYQMDSSGFVSLSSIPNQCPTPTSLSTVDLFNVTEFTECAAAYSSGWRIFPVSCIWLISITMLLRFHRA
ncbi:uncharacterized protein LOC129582661 [Paramacrobiotus metropolitanus]|uniref:uncharacterized protein LOC129582661 n=1 Tax=Paramacrobiotus metropolitanus TaxID=2943436 RepID=UPI00244593A3|nr:uncharacterized protein LOC129582661 [Paramacrobiotus metropolitanus]